MYGNTCTWNRTSIACKHVYNTTGNSVSIDCVMVDKLVDADVMIMVDQNSNSNNSEKPFIISFHHTVKMVNIFQDLTSVTFFHQLILVHHRPADMLEQ